MKIEGHCHCGAIAYEAEVDPAKAVDLPLRRLPDPVRRALSRQRPGQGRGFSQL